MAKNSTTKMWHLWSQLFSKAWNNWFVEHKKVPCKSKCKKLHIYEIIVVSFMNLNQTNYIIVSLLKLGTYFIMLYKKIYFVANNTKMSDFALIYRSSNWMEIFNFFFTAFQNWDTFGIGNWIDLLMIKKCHKYQINIPYKSK